MGTAFFGVMPRFLFEQEEDLRSEEPEAAGKENVVCLAVVSGSPWEHGLGKTLSYALMREKASVSWWLGSFFAWEVERGRLGALVVGMVMPFS